MKMLIRFSNESIIQHENECYSNVNVHKIYENKSYELDELECLTDSRLLCILLQISAALSKLKTDKGGPSMLIRISQVWRS